MDFIDIATLTTELRSRKFRSTAMHLKIITVGKPALSYTKAGIDEYLKRLNRHGGCEWIVVKAGKQEEESARLLDASDGSHRIALDERGTIFSTRELAGTLDAMRMDGRIKAVAFLIGGADGHTEKLRTSSDGLLSLSRLTMQHELASVVLLEQLYRCATLKSGSPYHRD